ncbi:MAG: hypothetical protein KDA32_13025 [Phycisphaerales bacterium]|nr:hypothetical protein [Phycisphaerales bacterium]
MFRAAVFLSTILAVLVGGCPSPTDGQGDSQRGEPGAEGPTTGGELLKGPGFSLALPNGLTLRETDSPHPGVTYWRYYLEDGGARAITVQVITGVGGVPALEEVDQRITGAVTTASGDFLLVGRLATQGGFSFETQAAVGVLSDGSTLVVQVAAPVITGADELIAVSVFASISLEQTDGYALQDRWAALSPQVLAHVGDDVIVLSDGGVWSLYSDNTFTEASELDSWNVNDGVVAQVLSDPGEAEAGALLHVGHWTPVEMYKVGTATELSIEAVGRESIDLSDGTSWIVGTTIAQSVKDGDLVFLFRHGDRVSFVFAKSGRSLTDPARVVHDDNFRLVLPSGANTSVDDFAAPAGTLVSQVFLDAAGVIYGVFVVPPTSATSTVAFENFQSRVIGSVQTASNDFLLVFRFEIDEAEALGALGELADGTGLWIYVVADQIDGNVELKGDSIFRSVSLIGTNGNALKETLQGEADKVLVKGDTGIVVLSDYSAWTLKLTPTPNDIAEFGRLHTGDSVFLQTYRLETSLNEIAEIVGAERWAPIEVKSIGFAIRTTIAAITAPNQLRLSDGSTWTFGATVPPGWNPGDEVMRVASSILAESLILTKTGQTLDFY